MLQFTLLLMVFSCQDDGGEMDKEVLEHTLIGTTWLNTEYGYSPGGAYQAVDVPVIPPQTIRFGDDLRLQTNIEGLDRYRYYRIADDTTRHQTVLAFYEEDPGDQTSGTSGFKHSYTVGREGEILKLYYRWCIEGCHLGFKRLSDSD